MNKVTGAHIAVERKRLKLDQQSLSDKLGVGRTWLSKMEKQAFVIPENIKKLNVIFGNTNWQHRSVEQYRREKEAALQRRGRGAVIIPRAMEHDAIQHILAKLVEMEARQIAVEKKVGINHRAGKGALTVPMTTEAIRKMLDEG